MKNNISLLKNDNKIPPEPPLSRVMREGCAYFCESCGSTMSKEGFLRLFGKRFCDNKKCLNSKQSNKISMERKIYIRRK